MLVLNILEAWRAAENIAAIKFDLIAEKIDQLGV